MRRTIAHRPRGAQDEGDDHLALQDHHGVSPPCHATLTFPSRVRIGSIPAESWSDDLRRPCRLHTLRCPLLPALSIRRDFLEDISVPDTRPSIALHYFTSSTRKYQLLRLQKIRSPLSTMAIWTSPLPREPSRGQLTRNVRHYLKPHREHRHQVQ